MLRFSLLVFLLTFSPCLGQTPAEKGNRLAYLDEMNLYYPHRDFPRLITPQWVGDSETEAVVILAIDDLRDSKKYEAYLRPILRRLQQIDGTSPVSIMSCQVDPKDPQLQTWLKEGLSLECHTYDHPCPFFKKGFDFARDTYHTCVDLMHQIPGNKPVCFRMPCCDSLNTPSPRFYAEIFNRCSPSGNYLTLDSSVFNVFTSADPELPRSLVLDEKGQERFTRYLPKDRSFVNTIENYPYPYPIGNLCWQFPCVTPSDWQANHLHKPNHPRTVEDWKAVLDCTVIKKGVFCLVFHPHGWIKSDQVVEFIDHAMEKHGKKVKFLTFRQAHDLLEKNVQAGQPLRRPILEKGPRGDNGIRILDIDNDGYLDAVLANECRLWQPDKRQWRSAPFPLHLHEFVNDIMSPGPYRYRQFGILPGSTNAALVVSTFNGLEAHRWDGKAWQYETLPANDFGLGDLMLRDLDGDGACEILWQFTPKVRGILKWSPSQKEWQRLSFAWPASVSLRDVKLADLDGDGRLDLIYSQDREYGILGLADMKTGWTRVWHQGLQNNKGFPSITRSGTDQGWWIHSGHFWWSNEDTALLKDFVDRRALADLIQGK